MEGSVLRGKYQILARLGEGGMGAVYKVQHMHFHEVWALKVVSQSLVEEAGFLERFRAESLLMRRLNHPNAVRVHDYDETDDGRPFMVMEYVEGTGLDKLVSGGRPLAPERAARIVMQVCDALGAAHKLGIIHRDIKPSNIVVTKTPEGAEVAKVLDFGIAKVKEQGSLYQASLTGTGMIVGTPAYMSPEQVKGVPGDQMDGRADLYSLGVVLYELLSGRTPFVGNTAVALLMAHASTPPPDPRTVRTDLPEALVAVALRALEKEPGDRYATAGEMHDALADFLAQSPATSDASAEPEVHEAARQPEAATSVTTPLPRRVTPPGSQPALRPPVEIPQQTPDAVASRGPSRKGTIWAATVILLCMMGGGAWYFLKSNSTPVASGATPPSASASQEPAKPEVKKDTEPPAQTAAPEPAAPNTTPSTSPARRVPAQPATKKAASVSRPAEKTENRHKDESKQQAGEFASRGLEEYKAGDYDAAINSFQAALQLDPENKEAQSGLSKVKEAQQEEEKIVKRRHP
ncbi:MAG TPA: protein kinase [Candidatus Acidoferrales bacterium]|nr:protein kinase [Candidatus Acidoferrales bacterium]